MVNPWFRYFLSFNPFEYLTKVKCPVLALNGSLDLQVPSQENLKAIEQALTEADNEYFQIKEFEGMNHLFQIAEKGTPSEYFNIEETINEDVLKFLAEWLLSLPK